jgi:DHA2 family multidrug resistance protein
VFSFRRYMIASAALFAIFSVACAFTHDLPSMIAMRGLQGFAGGVLIPMAFTLVLTKLPKSQQPVGLAIFACPSPSRRRSGRPSAAISPRITAGAPSSSST